MPYAVNYQPILLGIHGKKESGKTTAGNFFARHFDFCTYAFADPLKDACAIMMNWERDRFDNPSKKEVIDPFFHFSPRQLAQSVGTEGVRSLNHDTFVLLATERVDYVKSRHYPRNRLAITDVRFENEAAMIRDNGGIVLHIMTQDSEREFAPAKDTHASEAGVQMHSSDKMILNIKSRGLGMFHNQLNELAASLDW